MVYLYPLNFRLSNHLKFSVNVPDGFTSYYLRKNIFSPKNQPIYHLNSIALVLTTIQLLNKIDLFPPLMYLPINIIGFNATPPPPPPHLMFDTFVGNLIMCVVPTANGAEVAQYPDAFQTKVPWASARSAQKNNSTSVKYPFFSVKSSYIILQ